MLLLCSVSSEYQCRWPLCPSFFLRVSGIYFYHCSLLCRQLIETVLVNHQISPNHQFHTQAIGKKFKLSCHCRSLIVLSICKLCVKWDGGSGRRAFGGDSMYQQTCVTQHLVFKNHITYSLSLKNAVWLGILFTASFAFFFCYSPINTVRSVEAVSTQHISQHSRQLWG